MPRRTIRFDPAFAGPPFAANGGYTAGRLVEHLSAPAARVTLHAPVPLGRSLLLEVQDQRVALGDGTSLLTEATPAIPSAPPPAGVGFAEAVAAIEAADVSRHPFPRCFVCGVARRDGLGLFPAPVVPGVVATPWMPEPKHVDPLGTVPTRLLWAALDCPSAFAVLEPGEHALLASIEATTFRNPRLGEPLVVVGRGRGEEGRVRRATTEIHAADGEPVAVSETVWVAVNPEQLERIAQRMWDEAA